MSVKNFRLKKGKKLNIFPISDIHYGNPQCNVEYFEFLMDKFDRTKGSKIIYLLGDECDVATKRQGNSTYQQKINVNDQIEYIVDTFKPYKKNINGIVQSNHMARTKKEFDLDITKVIANELDIPYVNNIYETLKIGKKPYTVFGMHGNKTSQQQHLMMGAVQRQTDHIDANLFLYGHAHYTATWSQPKVSSDGYERRHYVLCGHMLNYKNSYAEVMGLKPNPPGFTKIQIDCNLRTNVEIFNYDECRLSKQGD